MTFPTKLYLAASSGWNMDPAVGIHRTRASIAVLSLALLLRHLTKWINDQPLNVTAFDRTNHGREQLATGYHST